jgi:arsenate reductase
MTAATPKPLRVLILCTGNSARSQMAEALFNALGRGRVVAESAGSQPAPRVNPQAIEALARHGITWAGHPPRTVAGLEREPWDAVITVCNKARETCPIFPGHPAMAHWGMDDPAEVAGSDDERREAFWQASLLLRKRIELMLALPLEKLERLAMEARLRAIGADARGADR